MAARSDLTTSAGPHFERNTRQRRAICSAFEASTRPLAIGELVEAVSRNGAALSLTTAYRTIRALLDEGWLAEVTVPGTGSFYELAGKDHHHHFSCLKCRSVYELAGCESPRVALPRGFRALSHETTVFGVCARCAGASNARSA